MSDDNTISPSADSSAVQTHINILQGLIQRMAENSRSSKTWCITLTSATLILVVRLEKPDYTLLALIPTILFLLLDTYYLALERSFRSSLNLFVRKLHNNELSSYDLYMLDPTGFNMRRFVASLTSFSIWFFYSTLALMILFAWKMVCS